MLFVLAVLLYLAISPVRSLISEMHLSAARSAQLQRLQRTSNELAAQLHGLSQASTAGAEARNLGYVRPGEHEFVITGLPNN
jgi:cell division protein FtsB